MIVKILSTRDSTSRYNYLSDPNTLSNRPNMPVPDSPPLSDEVDQQIAYWDSNDVVSSIVRSPKNKY